MKELVFKPRLKWLPIIFITLVLMIFGGVCLLIWIVNQNISAFIFGAMFILMGFYSLARRSTMVIIGETEVVLKRLFLPALVFEYEKFTDFTGSAFIFDNKGIPLDDMKNSKEFVGLFLPELEKRHIQSTGKYVADINRTNKALSYSVIPSFAVSILVTYILNALFEIRIDFRVIGLIVFLITLYGTHFILKNKEEVE